MSDLTRRVTIYGLYDADDPERRVRYVGQTTQPLQRRLRRHLYAAQRKSYPVYSKWLRSLPESRVKIVALEVCEHAQRIEREVHWIAELDAQNTGFNVNPGDRPTKERIAAWQAASQTPESRAKIAAKRRGRPLSESTKAKIGDALRGKSAPQKPAQSAVSRAGVRRINHVRWHVNRNQVNPGCEFCREGAV